jgi:hypothetical protein
MKTLTAFCDLKYCPVSYDFSTFIMRAMLERDRRGCDHLHVVIVPHEEGLGGFSRHWGGHDESATRWRLWHIVMPLCALAGATVSLCPHAQPMIAVGDTDWWPTGKAHLTGPLIDAARAGEKIPRLRATDAARRYVAQWFSGDARPVVTLTTRNQTTHPDRNTNPQAWREIGYELSAQGLNVIELIDSNDAFKDARGCWSNICPDMRLALYERAQMNLIGNNGPCGLLLYSDAPYLVFNFGQPSAQWADYVRDHLHMNYGEQLPWASAQQRLIWKADSYENMKSEFSEWEKHHRLG